ncbi:MAG: tetratricopeptide repeat protein [Burkholderiales bacterium]|nr:tetratricopeptide repeat protein [Burkholderiales bacterium]
MKARPWRSACLLAAAAAVAPASAAVDVTALWDFANPALSEQRFKEALAAAKGDDALVLTTQIARTWSLRRDPARAREVLKAIEPQLAGAGAEAQARHALEWGRSHISGATRAEERTPEALAAARAAYERALAAARAGGLDGLAIDAVHMMAFVDTAPADDLKWNQQALAMIEASSQPAAKAWEASIRNNLGHALHRLGRYPEALEHFQRALALREKAGSPRSIRIAHWMIAWTQRALGHIDEALAAQLRLEAEWRAAGSADPYVFEELEQLYRAKGDEVQARHYAQLHRAAKAP